MWATRHGGILTDGIRTPPVTKGSSRMGHPAPGMGHPEGQLANRPPSHPGYTASGVVHRRARAEAADGVAKW